MRLLVWLKNLFSPPLVWDEDKLEYDKYIRNKYGIAQPMSDE